MKQLNEFIQSTEEPINESILAAFIFMGILTFFGSRTTHKIDKKVNDFWDWLIDSKNAR